MLITTLADHETDDSLQGSREERISNSSTKTDHAGSDTERGGSRGRPRRRGLRPAITEESYGERNQMWKPHRADPYGLTVVGPSSTGGLGLFAKCKIRKGQRVAMYTWEYITAQQARDGRDLTYVWQGHYTDQQGRKRYVIGDSIKGDAAGGTPMTL